MPRRARIILSFTAGIAAVIIELYCNSLLTFIALIACLLAWNLLTPRNIRFTPVLANFRHFFLYATGGLALALPLFPVEYHNLFREIWDVFFLILVLIYAYAGWRDD